METRKKTQTPRMDRRALILTVVGALLVIAIIVIAVVLMQRSGGDAYRANYETAMERYIAADYAGAIEAANKAYAEDATEEAVLIIARSYAGLGDYAGAVSALEQWVNANGSGAEAGALLDKYRELASQGDDGDSVTIAGEKYPLDSQTLVISDKSLTAADLEAVASLTELTSLSLNNCSIGDISALSALENLTTLSLEDNSITDVSALSGMDGLTALYLGGNDIESLEPLYGLKNLTTLDIRGREITDAELEELQEALPDCTVLTDEPLVTVEEITLGGVTFKSDVTTLDLSNRGITDISPLAQCTQLESLDLSGNALTSISALASMPNLKTLDISGNQIASLSPLIALTALESLDASNNLISTVSALEGHTALTTLSLSGNPLADIKPLGGLTGLVSLGLADAGLDGGDLAALHTLTALKTLDLSGNSGINADAADALSAALPGCEISFPDGVYTVVLGGASFPADSTYVDASNQGVTSLDGVEHFTKLQVLVLNGNPGLNITAANVQAMSGLTALGLANCELTAIIWPLSELKQLTSLDLSFNDLTDISQVTHLTALTELNLSMNENLEDITALRGLTGLKSLYLNSTGVTDLAALSGLTALELLDIENCDIDDVTDLYALKGLRTLYAAGCGLTQQEIDELGRQLPNCTIYT